MARHDNELLLMLGALTFLSTYVNAHWNPEKIHHPKFESLRTSAIERSDVTRPVISHSVPSIKKTFDKDINSQKNEKIYVYNSFHNRNKNVPIIVQPEFGVQRRISKDFDRNNFQNKSQDFDEINQREPETLLNDDPDHHDSSNISKEANLDNFYHDSVRTTKSQMRKKLKNGPQKIIQNSKRNVAQKSPYVSRKYDQGGLAREDTSEEIALDQKTGDTTKIGIEKKVVSDQKKKKLKRRKVIRVRNRLNNNSGTINSTDSIQNTRNNMSKITTNHDYSKLLTTTDIPTQVTTSLPEYKTKLTSNKSAAEVTVRNSKAKSDSSDNQAKKKSAWSRDKFTRIKTASKANTDTIRKSDPKEKIRKDSDARVRTSFNERNGDRNVRHSRIKNEQIQHRGTNIRTRNDGYQTTEKVSSKNVNDKNENNPDVTDKVFQGNHNKENHSFSKHVEIQENLGEDENSNESEEEFETWQNNSNKKNEEVVNKKKVFSERPEIITFNKNFKNDREKFHIDENYKISHEPNEEFDEETDTDWSSLNGKNNNSTNDDYFMLSYKYMGNERSKEKKNKDLPEFSPEIPKPRQIKKVHPLPEKKLQRKKLNKVTHEEIKHDLEEKPYLEIQKPLNYQFSKRHREYISLEEDEIKYKSNKKIPSPPSEIRFPKPVKSPISFKKKEIKQVNKPSWAPIKHYQNSQNTHKPENINKKNIPTTKTTRAQKKNHKSHSFQTFSRGNEKSLEQDFPMLNSKTFEHFGSKSNSNSGETGKYFMHIFKRVGDVSLEDFDINDTKFPDKDGFTSLMKLSWNDDDRRAHLETAIDTRMRTPRQSLNTYYHPDNSNKRELAQASETILDHDKFQESEEYELPIAQHIPEDSSQIYRAKRSTGNHFVRSHFRMGGNNFVNMDLNNRQNLPQMVIDQFRARQRSRSLPHVHFPKSTAVVPRYANPPNRPRNLPKPPPHQIKSYYLKPEVSADRKKLMKEFENQNLGMRHHFDTYEKSIRETKQVPIFHSYTSPQRVQIQRQKYSSPRIVPTKKPEITNKHNSFSYSQYPNPSLRKAVNSNLRTPSETKEVRASIEPIKESNHEKVQFKDNKDFGEQYYPTDSKYLSNHNQEAIRSNVKFKQNLDKIEHSPTEREFYRTLSNSQVQRIQTIQKPIQKTQHRHYSSLDDGFLNYPTLEMKRYQEKPRNAHSSFQYENEHKYHDNSHVFKGNYPRYNTIPKTQFSCEEKKHPGYYADPETGCQVFHMCHGSGIKHSFLCPNSTIFNQQLLVCDWYSKVNCENGRSFHQVNEQLFNHDLPHENKGNSIDYSNYGWESKPLQARSNPYQEYADRKGPDSSAPLRRKNMQPSSTAQFRNHVKDYEPQINISDNTNQRSNAEKVPRTILTAPNYQSSTEKPKIPRTSTTFEDKVNRPKGFHYFTENEYLVIHSEVPLKKNESTESYINKNSESKTPSKTSTIIRKEAIPEYHQSSKTYQRHKPKSYNRNDKKSYSSRNKNFGQKAFQQPNLKSNLASLPKEKGNDTFSIEKIQDVKTNISSNDLLIKPLPAVSKQLDKNKSAKKKISTINPLRKKNRGQNNESRLIINYAKDGVLFPTKGDKKRRNPLHKHYTNSNTSKVMSSSESSIYVYPLQGTIQNSKVSNITNPENTGSKLSIKAESSQDSIDSNKANYGAATKKSDVQAINITSRIVDIISGLDTIGDDISKILDGKDSIYKNVQVHKLIPKKSENVGSIEIPPFESGRKPQQQNKQSQVNTVKQQGKSFTSFNDRRASLTEPIKLSEALPNIPSTKELNNPREQTDNTSSSQHTLNNHFIKFVSTEPTNSKKQEISPVFPTTIPSGLKFHDYTIQADDATKINYTPEESQEHVEKIKYTPNKETSRHTHIVEGNKENISRKIPQIDRNIHATPSSVQYFNQNAHNYGVIPSHTLHQNLLLNTSQQNSNQFISPKTITMKSNADIIANKPNQFSFTMYAPPHTNVHFRHNFNDDGMKQNILPNTAEQSEKLKNRALYPNKNIPAAFIFRNDSPPKPGLGKERVSLTTISNFPTQKINKDLVTSQQFRSPNLKTYTSIPSPIINNHSTEECDDSEESNEKSGPSTTNIKPIPQNIKPDVSQIYTGNKSGFKPLNAPKIKFQLTKEKNTNVGQTSKNSERVFEKPYYINKPPHIIKPEMHHLYQKDKENIRPASDYHTNIQPTIRQGQPNIKLMKFFKGQNPQEITPGTRDFVPKTISHQEQNGQSNINPSYNGYSDLNSESSEKSHEHVIETAGRHTYGSNSKYADLEREAELEALRRFKNKSS